MAETNTDRQNEINDLKAVLNTPQGKRVLRRFIGDTGLFRSTFSGENTHSAAFAEGRRNVGLFIYSEIVAADPTISLEIIKGDL